MEWQLWSIEIKKEKKKKKKRNDLFCNHKNTKQSLKPYEKKRRLKTLWVCFL